MHTLHAQERHHAEKHSPRGIAATDVGEQRVWANPARDVQQHVKFLLTLCATWCAFTFIGGPSDSARRSNPCRQETTTRLPLFGSATPPENTTVNEPSNPLCQIKYVHVAQVAYVRGLQSRVIHARQGSNFEVFRDTMLGPWDQQNRWYYTPYDMERYLDRHTYGME